ncbi:MAG TPA: hypothetical protein ENI85_01625 [Deltaproteobacteria bacterium]|nr:hypothetical protein [Deltaproteobacteria bacterium]
MARDEEGLFDRIRSACAEVTSRARFVRIEAGGVERLARRFATASRIPIDLDPAHDFRGDESETLAFTILLDAINFGSGWFPLLRKRTGLSGYRTIATICRERFEREGCPRGERLRSMTGRAMAELLEQDAGDPAVIELMDLYARAWRDLGDLLAAEFDDRFEGIVEAADHSAERLVRWLTRMPLYRDVSRYAEIDVPFYKRAQITAADLARNLSGKGLGRFDDLDRLTLFADNLVPHVLRCEGVLRYDPALVARIDAGERLETGSEEEVEIRAVALEAVERIVAELEGRGVPITAHELDGWLWNAGQAPRIKAIPRHRARSPYY